MLTNKDTNIVYFAPRAQAPFIIKPKTDNSWQRDRSVRFEWLYNGFDAQVEFTLQILVKSLSSITDEEDAVWNFTDSSSTPPGEISDSYLYELVSTDFRTFTTIDLNDIQLKNGSTVSLTDGAYRWRIKVKGVVAKEYSPWANDGFVRLDSEGPKIMNASAFSPAGDIVSQGAKSKLVANISDMSMPYLLSRRDSDSGYDRHIDRDGFPSFYVTYDYRDHSLVFRAQSGSDQTEPKQRYYGLLSFHDSIFSDQDPIPDFNIQDVIKAAYLYSINKKDGSVDSLVEDEGAFQETLFADTSEASPTNFALEDIIDLQGYNDTINKRFRPKGFPNFIQGNLFEANILTNHPATIDKPHKKSFFSVFPIHSQHISGPRTVNFDAIDSKFSERNTFVDFVEFRYGPPFEDVFIYVTSDLRTILAYGQYDSNSTTLLQTEPETDQTLTVLRGLNLQKYKSYGETIEKLSSTDRKYEVFDSNNSSIVVRCLEFDNGEFSFPVVPRSNYLYFNLVPTVSTDRDVALKLYLNREIYNGIYEDNAEKRILDSFEIYMSPDCDYSLAYKDVSLEYDSSLSGESIIGTYKQPIPIDQVKIGRAKISPKALPMYEIQTTLGQDGFDITALKKYFKYIKYNFDQTTITTPLSWGDEQDYFLSNDNEDREYNSSFRIKIPEYKWASYYHPTSVNYAKTGDNSVLPHILDADPNLGSTDNIINWDSIEIASSSFDSFDINNLMKFEFFYPSDFAKMEGGAQYYSQSNPHYYNHSRIQEDDYNRGLPLRIRGSSYPYSGGQVKDYGWMIGSYALGNLAYSLYNIGWHHDGTWYNFEDRGFWGLADVEPIFEYVQGSLQVFLNGQLLTCDNSIVENSESNSPIAAVSENIKNKHEFSFVNLSQGGLFSPPNENDTLSISFRVLDYEEKYEVVGPYYINGDDSSNQFTLSDFGQSGTFIPGSIRIFLNGILLAKNIDYEELLDSTGFKFISYSSFNGIPSSEDEITIFYKKSGATATTEVRGPYFTSGKTSKVFSLENDFQRSETFESQSLQVYLNGLILERDVEYVENVGLDGFVIDSSVTLDSTDTVAIIYDTIPISPDVVNEIIVGPFFISPNASNIRYSVRGYYSANSKINTRIRFRDFSNHLFRKSLKVLIDNNESVSGSRVYDQYISSTEDYTTWIQPYGNPLENGESFVFGTGSVLDSEKNSQDPSWILYNQDFSESDLNRFTNSLVASDYSAQGLYPVSGDSDSTWTSSNMNVFGGYFLSAEDGSGNSVIEQIKRTVIDKPDTGDTITIFGPLRSSSNIIETEEALVSGDIFSIGNIFGKIYPDSSGQSQKVKIFIDVDETISGINGIKYFVTNLSIESSENTRSKYYWGAEDSNGDLTGTPILMQKINNLVVDFSDSTSIEESITLLQTSRSAVSFVKWYFENRISTWETITSQKVEDISDLRASYGLGRIEKEITVSGTGYKLIYIQIKDKGNNASNIYCIPIYIEEQNELVPEEIGNVTISVDEDYVARSEEFTLDDDTYKFLYGLNVRDKDEFRSVTFKRLLEKYDLDVDGENKETFRLHRKPDNVLLGLSDNYGLSYNIFAPYTSVKNWRFDRPISIPIKYFTKGYRGPEWFFDPNDVRHYTVDTTFDYSVGFGTFETTTVLNNVDNPDIGFHVPANGTLQPITLIGLRADDIDGEATFAKGNPIANKIYENRDEIIGKKIILGALPSQTFTILHVFQTNFLSDVKQFSSVDIDNTDSYRTVDGDISGVKKTWIVVSDPEATCALILSRKLQYINLDNASVDEKRYQTVRDFTGTSNVVGINWYSADRSFMSQKSGSADSDIYETKDFGYYQTESSIPSDVNTIVNSALGMDGDVSEGFNPTRNYNEATGQEFFYIIPSETLDINSDLLTNEGWSAQVFHAYDPEGDPFSPAIDGILTSFDKYHNQLLGVSVLSKMVFGESVTITATVDSAGASTFTDNEGNVSIKKYAIISEGRFDQTMGGMQFALIDTTNDNEVLHEGTILSVSSGTSSSETDSGRALILEEELPSLDYSTGNYSIRVTVQPLQSTDSSTNTTYSQGWFPDIDGFLVPYFGQPLGTVTSSNKNDVQKNTRFAVIFRGAFYISQEGSYTFRLEKNSASYADMNIDYFDTSGLVYDTFEDYTTLDDSTEVPVVSKAIGGGFSAIIENESVLDTTTETQTFMLRKGWHMARVRFISNRDPLNAPKQVLNVKYSRPNWGENYVPLIGSNTNDYNFMAKSFRTIHARLIDELDRKYPIVLGFNQTTVNRTLSTRMARAVVGFYESLIQEPRGRLLNQIASVARVGSESYGELLIKSPDGYESSSTFGGQLLEEASGIYESNIIDGGSDFRFWRTISWTLNSSLPTGTTLEFYIRTSDTEEELLTKTYNNIGTETSPNLVPAITSSGTDILQFSQQTINVTDEPKIYRFLQFKMVMKSRVKGNTPTVNDVTITYSKLNSVNFFTTTFNLNSNIVRAILTYNGETPVDPNGVSLSEVQFGICTKEVSDGVVSTNFDDYVIIPVNEAFSLSSLGINATPNDSFRIGIKFISTENATPIVDDFAMMWESSGQTNRTIDFL